MPSQQSMLVPQVSAAEWQNTPVGPPHLCPNDGEQADLDALLDPGRVETGYGRALHGAGAVQGHEFGLDLGPDTRADLLAFLGALSRNGGP